MVILSRTSTGDEGTTGSLGAVDDEGGEFSCLTLELPWRDNAPSISCIPAGEYECRFTWSNGLKRWCYILADVPGRSGVRIHSGNYGGDKAKGLRSHIQGCILLGGYFARNKDGQLGIFDSISTVREFQDFMGEQPFTLRIEG